VRISYSLTITQKPGYLHAVVTGSNNKENLSRYLAEIRRECSVQGYARVLIEERLEGPRLRTMEVFRCASEGSGRGLGHFEAIAYVDVNAQGDLMEFAETVAVNRGLPVRVFSLVSDAERWLQGQNRRDTPENPSDGRK